MPKQVIVSMQDNYPFGECQEVNGDMVRVYVRKVYQVSQQADDLDEKVSILRKLKNEHMIKIESVLQQEQTVHFMFQYVPIKLETWISNINDQFIENFRDQLIKFSSYLANSYIKIEFQLKNIGMDQNYNAKYFIDLNFQYDRTLNRQKLKSNYIRQITNLFKPYIQHNAKPQNSLDSDRQIVSVDYGPNKNDLSRRNDISISPPTNRPPNKNKEKALEKYYQEVNMSVDSQNEKILQEFMDVLDNEEEEQHSMPPPQKQNASMSAVSPPVSTSQPIPINNQNSYSLTQTEHQVSRQNSNNSPYFSAKELAKGSKDNRVGNSQSQPQQQYQQFQPQLQQKQSQPQVNIPSDSNKETRELQEQKYSHSTSNQPSEHRLSNETNKTDGDVLQDRVKKAIEKSMDVIKKFKSIKDNMQ